MIMLRMLVPRILYLDWYRGKVPRTLICHKIQSCIGPWSSPVHTRQTNLKNKNKILHLYTLIGNKFTEVLNMICYLIIFSYILLPFLLSLPTKILCALLILHMWKITRLKIIIFLDVASSGLADGHQRFEGTSNSIFRMGENGSKKTLQNTGIHLPHYMVSHPSHYQPKYWNIHCCKYLVQERLYFADPLLSKNARAENTVLFKKVSSYAIKSLSMSCLVADVPMWNSANTPFRFPWGAVNLNTELWNMLTEGKL